MGQNWFLRVNLFATTVVTSMKTQGAANQNAWVSSLKVVFHYNGLGHAYDEVRHKFYVEILFRILRT